jgi:uncharacterized membrane-anchored protein
MQAWRVILAVLVFAGSATAVAAKDKSPDPTKPAEAEKAKAAKPGKADDKVPPDVAAAAAEAADADSANASPDGVTIPHVVGPKQVNLGHHAVLDLPAGMILLEQTEAQEILRKGGDDPDGVIALIVPPRDSEMSWEIVIAADEVGYVSDDDADDLDAGEMLEQYKQATIRQNPKRVAAGSQELFVDNWSEAPHYEPAKHHLVWGLNAHVANGKLVNFFTRFLGRNGFLSVNLIDDPDKIEASKADAMSVLTALRFEAESRYEDHVSSDRDSGLGLKALVLGGAGVVIAKKTGLLIAILLVLKKGFIVVAAAVAGFFRWMFRRRKAEAAGPAPVARDPDPPSTT